MIHLGCAGPRPVAQDLVRPLNQGTTTCRAPVRHGVLRKLGVALAADPFHYLKDYRIRRTAPALNCRTGTRPVH